MFFRDNNSNKYGAEQKYNPFFRQLIFLGLLVTAGYVILHQLKFLLGSLLGSVVIYIAMRGILFKLTDEYKWKRWIASLALILFLTIVLLSIGYLIYEVIAAEIPNLDASRIIEEFKKLIVRVNGYVGYAVIPEKMLSSGNETFREFVTKFFAILLNTTYSFVINIFFMLIILFFMFLHGREMENKIYAYFPFRGKNFEVIAAEVKNMIYSNVIVIPMNMLVQGLSVTFVYWIIGMNNIVFWGFLTAVCGLLPVLGTSLVIIPLGIYMFAAGNIWQGIVLLLPGLLIVTNIDNVVRIVLMKKMANTHPLIVIFGVIMGIPLFGFWGIIFGPLMISVFILLIKIYYIKYGLISKEETEMEPDLSPPPEDFSDS